MRDVRATVWYHSRIGNPGYYTGRYYNYQQGIAQDYGEAARWYRLAADQGHAGAQNTPGTTLGSYTVTAQIGAGGMGEVYLGSRQDVQA